MKVSSILVILLHSTTNFCLVFCNVSEGTNTIGCLDPASVDYSADYFPEKVSPQFSQHWNITYHNTYKILNSSFRSYLLYQCGTEIPSDQVGLHDGYHKVPLQDGLTLDSTTLLPHMEQLGLRRQVTGWFSSHDFISSPCMNSLADAGVMPEVNSTTQDAFFLEYPEVVVVGAFSSGVEESRKIIVGPSNEEESKDIYEWHKVFGALFNLEKVANDQFDASSSRYDCASDNAGFLFEQEQFPIVTPKVAWAYYSDPSFWGGSGEPYWDVARCDDKYNYYCEFADACLAEILHSNSGSIGNEWLDGDYHMTTEEFMNFAKDADHWIYTGFNWDNVWEQFGSELSTLKSIQSNEVYDTSGSGGGTWFEQRVAEYDVVVQDFCEVVGRNNDLLNPHTRTYFRKLLPDAELTGSLGECPYEDVDLPWESRASQCISLRSDPNNPNDDPFDKIETSGAFKTLFPFINTSVIIAMIVFMNE